MKFVVMANWKMNGLPEWQSKIPDLRTHLQTWRARQSETLCTQMDDLRLVICPPAPLLPLLKKSAQAHNIALGAQNCHHEESGAYTGETSASLVAACGAHYVLVGHSERRQFCLETDEMVARKAIFAQMQGLVPVICVGEDYPQREKGKAYEIVGNSLRACFEMRHKEHVLLPPKVMIAYEPIWAIGTGLSAHAQDIADMHMYIRQQLTTWGGKEAANIEILYGGSVKASNVAKIADCQEVNGVLVGGASLNMETFAQLVQALCT